MTSQAIIREFSDIASERALEPALLLAVAELETNLRPFALVDGRKEPLIRFEGHYFDRRLSPNVRDRARQAGLSSPKAGAIANPADQPARWALLERPPPSTKRPPMNRPPGGSDRSWARIGTGSAIQASMHWYPKRGAALPVRSA